MITYLIIIFCLSLFFIFLTYYTGIYFDNKRYKRWRNASQFEIQEYKKLYGYEPI